MAKSISDLPAELMMQIFEQVKTSVPRDLVNATLISCAQVNKQWNSTATRVIWRAPEFHRRHQLQSLIQVMQRCQRGETMHQYHRHVQQLSIGHFLSRSINDEDIRQLLQQLNGAKLKRLNLGHCVQLTDGTMQLIADSCPDLESFSVEAKTGYHNFNKHTIDSVFMKCKRLREVGFFNSSQIDDDTIAAMARHCQNLNKLMLVFCDNVGDASIDTLVQNCHQLETVYITSDTITETESVHQLAKRCRIVYISIRQQQQQETHELNNNGGAGDKPANVMQIRRSQQVKLMKNASHHPLQIEYNNQDE